MVRPETLIHQYIDETWYPNRMAIEQGVAQGRAIGDYIIHALDTRKTAELIEP